MKAASIEQMKRSQHQQEREIASLKDQLYDMRDRWILAGLQRDQARYQQGKLGRIIARQRLALRKLRAELEQRQTPEEKLARAATKQWRRERAHVERTVGQSNG